MFCCEFVECLTLKHETGGKVFLILRGDAREPLNRVKCISFQRLCVILRVQRANTLRRSDNQSQEMFSLAKPVEFQPAAPKSKTTDVTLIRSDKNSNLRPAPQILQAKGEDDFTL